LSDSRQPLLVWSSDEKVVAAIYSSGDNTYEIKNLPAGEYMIGSYFMRSSAPLMKFSLSKGDSKILDIDTSDWSALQRASLIVQILGANGVPLTAAEVWLQGYSGQIQPLMNTGEGYAFVTEPGEYTLHAVGPGYKEATKKVWLEAGVLTEPRMKESTVLLRLEKK